MKQFYLKLLMLMLGLNVAFAQTTNDNNLEVIKEYLVTSGMNQNDSSDLKIQSQAFSKSMNLDMVYVIQQYKGIPIRNAIGTFAVKDGKVVHFAGTYINDIAAKINTQTPVISAEAAVRNASSSLDLGTVSNMEILNKKSANQYVMSKGNISVDDIPVALVYEIKDDKLVLAWDLSIHTISGKNWYSVRMDAQNGALITKDDWILKCTFDNHYLHNSNSKKKTNQSFNMMKSEESSNMLMTPSYRVFALPTIESPNHGARTLVSDQEDTAASPFGWHDTDGAAGAEFTTTQGNNVLASENTDASGTPGAQPDGGANLVFDYPLDLDAPFVEYQEASTTNLFYANNVTHDIWYQYGFDEASGNFQVNNYGNGGVANDAVLAFSQDGSSTNNATFGTPPDGQSGVMSMFMWNPNLLETILTVTNTGLAGDYSVRDSSFSPGGAPVPMSPTTITGNLVLAIDDDPTIDPNDACTDLINAADINGNIAVVRRGDCPFTDKVLKCQDAGAIAVIVVNNVPGEFGLGGGNFFVSTPAVAINQADGEALITEMASSTISVSLTTVEGDGSADADGSFDNGIIAHEYGHGISTRLAGGASTNGCLSGEEQMGEGWSDWFALMMTIEPGDAGTDARGIGTYAVGQPVTGGGIRPFPYSTDMTVNPVTYTDVANTANFTVPHGVGSIWAAILWDMTWAFIERDGFDPDLYKGTGGNNLAMQLVIDGLKLQGCGAGFVSGRDGILAAADLLPNSDANKCVIWEVFANRGVGYSADEGTSGSRTDQTVAFDLPPVSELDCASLGIDDFNSKVFTITPNPSRGIFNISVAQSIGDSEISIFDMNGRVVFKQQKQLETVHSINTDLGTGIYLLRIEAKNGSATITSKIVVQ